MPNISNRLAKVKTDFARTYKTQLGFTQSLSSIYKKVGSRYAAINKTQRERLYEMAFIALFTAWEQFTENAFEMLVMNARLPTFMRRNLVLVANLNTAHDLIRGSRRYVDWADPDTIRDRAKIFFKKGEPFESVLNEISNDLLKMRTIRNRCVHYSQYAIEKYNKMIRQVYGSGKRITPGRLLSDAPPSGLSTVSGATGYGSVFELYCEILSMASSKIIP